MSDTILLFSIRFLDFFFCVSVLYCVMLMSVCTCPDTIVVGPINLDPTWVGNFRDQCEEKTHKGFRYLAGLKKRCCIACQIFFVRFSSNRVLGLNALLERVF